MNLIQSFVAANILTPKTPIETPKCAHLGYLSTFEGYDAISSLAKTASNI